MDLKSPEYAELTKVAHTIIQQMIRQDCENVHIHLKGEATEVTGIVNDHPQQLMKLPPERHSELLKRYKRMACVDENAIPPVSSHIPIRWEEREYTVFVDFNDNGAIHLRYVKGHVM